MSERLTTEARRVIVGARAEAELLRHPFVGTEHLLLGLLRPDTGLAYQVLTAAGVTYERALAMIDAELGRRGGGFSSDDADALRTVGIDLDAVLERIGQTFGRDALAAAPRPLRRGLFRRESHAGRFSARARKVLQLALREALALHDERIGTEHLLLGLVREGDGLAAAVLTDLGVALPDLRAAVLRARDQAA